MFRWRVIRQFGVVAAVLCGPSLFLFAQSNDGALKDRLNRAASLTSLDESGLKPWHLKMQVQLYDFHGKPKENGTIEEWWSGPKSYRIVYSLPSYSATELHTEDGSFSSHVGGRVPYYLKFLREEVVDPIPNAAARANFSIEMSEKKSGAVELELLSLHSPLEKDPSTGYHRTYCFEKDKDILDILLISSDFQTEASQRTKLGRFQGKSVALGLRVEAAGKVIAEAQVDELKGQGLPYPETKDSAGLIKDASPLPTGELVQAGQNTGKVPPIYPAAAKADFIQGSVILSALISESGKIESLEVISSPDKSLSDAALYAVKQWTYSPYLVGGAAAKVDTMVTVNFRLSR